jgi:hypothetical protein
MVTGKDKALVSEYGRDLRLTQTIQYLQPELCDDITFKGDHQSSLIFPVYSLRKTVLADEHCTYSRTAYDGRLHPSC